MAKRGRPKAQDLPGMEDRAIKPLEDAAQDYARIRDERIELNASEANLKASVRALMKKHGKTVYRHGGVTITLIAEEETVKVRVRKAGDGDDADQDEDATEKDHAGADA